MAEEHGTLDAFGVIFLCWAAVFFGVWVFPLAETSKVILDILSTVAFVLFGVVYFISKGKIPSPSEEMWRKMNFWFDNLVYWTFAVLLFLITYVSWEFKTINGVQVVTYGNLASLFFGACGVLLLVYTIWRINKRNPSKKTSVR